MTNKDELIGEYAVFLESVINSNVKNVNEPSALEITDNRLTAVYDFFENRNIGFGMMTYDVFKEYLDDIPSFMSYDELSDYVQLVSSSSKEVPCNYLYIYEVFLKNIDMIMNLDVIYANMPFIYHNEIIRKFSLLARQTNATALFGMYGYNCDFDLKYKKNVLEGFRRCLKSKGISYNDFIKNNDGKHFEIVMSKR